MELNWLPDHSAVSEILGRIDPPLSENEARDVISKRSGLVPAAIDPTDETVIWADVGTHSLKEWQFVFSLAEIAKQESVLTIKTKLKELPQLGTAVGPTIAPAGFIFHMSRCGSTLLGNVLNAPRQTFAINQPGPLQDGFWTVLTNRWASNWEDRPTYRPLFRHLVGAILRQRYSGPTRGFIKFRSWNVLFVSFIQDCFPDVPCLFMYRNPIEVVASTARKSNVASFAPIAQRAFLANCDLDRVSRLSDETLMLLCYQHYLKTALENASRLKFLNYSNLKPGNLEQVLVDSFGLKLSQEEIEQMKKPFEFYSKDQSRARTAFSADRDLAAKSQRAEIDPANAEVLETLTGLYTELNRISSDLS